MHFLFVFNTNSEVSPAPPRGCLTVGAKEFSIIFESEEISELPLYLIYY